MTFRSIRKPSIGYWTDFKHRFKAGVLITLAVICMQLYSPAYSLVTESRTYRDVVGLSAFRDVTITRVVIDGKTMTVWGFFKKVRCEKIIGSDVAYTVDGQHRRHLALFDPSKEHPKTPKNRPPSIGMDAFGPWTITSLIREPKGAQFNVSHRCAEGPVPSLVFNIPWKEM